MPLIDDGNVARADNDLVTGIYFVGDRGDATHVWVGGAAGRLLAKQ